MAHLQDLRFTPDFRQPHYYEVDVPECLADKLALIGQFKAQYPAVPPHLVHRVALLLQADTVLEISTTQGIPAGTLAPRMARLTVRFAAGDKDCHTAYYQAVRR